jgi:hypothetical protein
MNLPGGKNPARAEEICRIIEACGKAKVSSLKWGVFEVHFYPGQVEKTTDTPIFPPTDEPMSDQPDTEAPEQGDEEDPLMTAVTSPVDFEEEVIRRELANGQVD